MKKLLFLLLCCTVFVIGCNKGNANKTEDADQMEMSEPSAGGDASSSVADQSSAEGKKALDTDKDYAKAVEAFTKSLEAKEAAWVYADRGRAKVLLGDKDGALADFTKAIDLEKRDVYYQWRGELYTEMGNAAAAQADQAEFERLQKEAGTTK
jgi:tetratricopeptide (TPR) repeat protein